MIVDVWGMEKAFINTVTRFFSPKQYTVHSLQEQSPLSILRLRARSNGTAMISITLQLHGKEATPFVPAAQIPNHHPFRCKCIIYTNTTTGRANVVRVTHLLQLLEVFPQELQRPLGLSDAQVDDALFEDLLDVVFLHEDLAAFQTFVFFQIGGGGGHLIFYHCCRRKERRRGEEKRCLFLSLWNLFTQMISLPAAWLMTSTIYSICMHLSINNLMWIHKHSAWIDR